MHLDNTDNVHCMHANSREGMNKPRHPMTQKGEGDTPGAIWYFNHAIRQYSLIAQLPCQQSQKCQTLPGWADH